MVVRSGAPGLTALRAGIASIRYGLISIYSFNWFNYNNGSKFREDIQSIECSEQHLNRGSGLVLQSMIATGISGSNSRRGVSTIVGLERLNMPYSGRFGMLASSYNKNEFVSRRLARFESAVKSLNLNRTLRSIQKAKASKENADGNWNLEALKQVFDTFRVEAGALDPGMKSGILLLNGLWLDLQSCKNKPRMESDVFEYTIFEQSDKVDSTLGALHASLDFLLSQARSAPIQMKPDFARSATYVAMIAHMVRLETRGEALRRTFRSLFEMMRRGDSPKKDADQMYSEFIKVRYSGTKKSDAESIRDAIAHANFKDLGNQKIRFSVRWRGNEFEDIMTYADILMMNNWCEKRIVIAEMYFFLLLTIYSMI